MKIKPLSKLELEVMEIIWSIGECSVRDVLEEMHKEKHLAYTTIATVMTRLVEKGTLSKIEDDTSITYKPKLSKEAVGKTVVNSFISKFFKSYGDAAIASFAESIDQLPKKKKEYLLELLEEHDKTK